VVVSLLNIAALIGIFRYAIGNHSNEPKNIIQMIPCPEKTDVHIKNSPKKGFFDLGANTGDSVASFVGYLPRAMGGAALNHMGSNGGWEIYAFEANPVFNDPLHELQQKILNEGNNNLHLFNETAIWIYDGNITFYLDTVNKKNDFWGSSLLSDHPDVKKSGGKSVTVKCVDLHRIIVNNFDPDDTVIVKMDIEGAEWGILRYLFQRGTLAYIDELYVEPHTNVGDGNAHYQAFRWITEGASVHWDWG